MGYSTSTAKLEAELALWEGARDALIGGHAQSYTIGGQSIEYFKMKDIIKRIEDLESRLARRGGALKTLPVFKTGRGF